MTNPLLRSSKAHLTSVSLTVTDIKALCMLSRGECTGATETDSDSATIARRVLYKLVENKLACLVSLPNMLIERARITELGRDVLRQLDLVAR